MNMAAMEYTERTKRENNFFLCTSNKNLAAVDMLKAVVDDLHLLEKGIEMYSYDHGEYVLVVSSLLFFNCNFKCYFLYVFFFYTCSLYSLLPPSITTT